MAGNPALPGSDSCRTGSLNPAGSTGTVNVRNPWPGRQVQVVDGGDESTVVVSATSAAQIAFPVTNSHSYLVQEPPDPVSARTVASVTGTPATRMRTLGSASIGLPATSELVGVASGRCLDDPGGSTTAGTQVGIWDCGTGTNLSGPTPRARP